MTRVPGITLALGAALLVGLQTLAPAQARESAAQKPDIFWVEGGPDDAPGRPGSFAELAEQVSKAVVFIEIERDSPEDESFFRRLGPPHGEQSKATGSGFILSPDGYIATNDHVIDQAAKITVRLLDGTILPASVIGRDKKTDLALIKVEPREALPVVPLGDSDAARIGDWVVAIGNPFGLDHSVTVGILSAKGRQLDKQKYGNFLQTDASINPGNSGGPLIDTAGRVIGINSAIKATVFGQPTGIGFAIPINMAKALLPQLKTTGRVTRGYLGVSIQQVDPTLAEGLGLEDTRGALVADVFADTPADGRLERGDVIIEFNGKAVETVDDLPRIVAATAPGSEVEVVVRRDGRKKTIQTVLNKLKDEEPIQLTSAPVPTPLGEWGFEVEDLTQELAEQLDSDTGVVITEVTPSGAAAEQGLRASDVIIEANRQAVASAAQLEEILESTTKASLLVKRNGQTFYRGISRE